MATRRAGQTGQIDFQGRSHFDPGTEDCGSYRLVKNVGPSKWEVEWTAPCDQDPGAEPRRSTLQFVSRDEYDRYF